MSKVVVYYMTPVSPWTYLGHDRFRALCASRGAQIQLRVMDLGKVFPASGGVALKDRPPQRRAYRLMELKRWRDFLGVPLNIEPRFFPVPAEAPTPAITTAGSPGTIDMMLNETRVTRNRTTIVARRRRTTYRPTGVAAV